MTYVGQVVDHASMHAFGLTGLIYGMVITLYGIVWIHDHVIGCGGYEGAKDH